jgi:hypothetical protein
MFKTTLSTVTAVVITMGAIHAETGISYDGTQVKQTTKDMMVVGKTKVEETSYIEVISDEPSYTDEVMYEPVYEPEPYTATEVVKPSPNYANTIIYAKPSKKVFKVNQAIQISLKLKNKSSLYFWTVGSDGRGYMILPNEFNGYNKFKRNYAYVFPEKSLNYEFQSDRAGVEHIYILATSKPISNAKMKEIFNKKVGNYPVASAKATKAFTTKDIHVIAKKENFQYDIAYVAVQVVDKSSKRVKAVQPQRHRNSDITININN